MDTLRISDADREAAIDLLGEQYAAARRDVGHVGRSRWCRCCSC